MVAGRIGWDAAELRQVATAQEDATTVPSTESLIDIRAICSLIIKPVEARNF